jgi:PAS domain S-box-containing protein
METAIKILHLEDNPTDSLLVQLSLKKANLVFDYYFADNENDYQQILDNQTIDLVLSDYHLPDYSGSEALLYIKEYYPQIPFVFISGTMGEDAAIESLLNGATDYVLKNKMERLVPAVHRAYNEAQMLKARRKAENELRKLSRAVEQSPNSVVITDTDGIVEYANSTTFNLTGYTSAELIGQNPRIFSSGETSQAEYQQLWETIKSGKEWIGEFHNKKKNGELYWEAATISPILDESGAITHFLAIKKDITEGKKLNSELLAAKVKAEESDRLKTAFLHNISHEIRTPMNAIVGFSGLLNDADLLPEKQKEYIEIIAQSSDQLLSIINDIVCIATIEAGQEKLSEVPVNLNAMQRILYEKFLPKARSQNIIFDVNTCFHENEYMILADEAKLVQILLNLIGNAFKFTLSGHIHVGCNLKNNELEFFVEDTGIGIPSEMHDEIFMRFRQVESTTARQFGGSGLGLSISKAYVELLGGKMWLTSELGKGSVFYFTLPFKKVNNSEEPAIKQSKQFEISSKSPKTLLIAEDEDSNYLLLEILLSGLNIQLIRAINGVEAVDSCKNDHIDMVLMDIKMPVMDGYEATMQIRDFMPDLPIIAQTAYTTDADKNRALACGCSDFISKPFKREVLIAKIKALL